MNNVDHKRLQLLSRLRSEVFGFKGYNINIILAIQSLCMPLLAVYCQTASAISRLA